MRADLVFIPFLLVPQGYLENVKHHRALQYCVCMYLAQQRRRQVQGLETLPGLRSQAACCAPVITRLATDLLL